MDAVAECCRGSRKNSNCALHCSPVPCEEYHHSQFLLFSQRSHAKHHPSGRRDPRCLAHQLIRQIPGLSEFIVPQIRSDPLIFTKSLETQFQCLLFGPLQQLLSKRSWASIVVLLFDGVDECNGHKNQMDLVRLMANLLSSRVLPIIAFFGSRAEYQLQQVFRSHDVSTGLLQLALDDHYLPEEDIRLFLNDKFSEIKNTHPLNHYLDKNWPAPAHVHDIIQKSSGQFIYTSAVINFVSSPRKHPAHQLEIIRGLRPAGNLTPFAQLDAFYQHILSQVEDIDSIYLILAGVIFGGNNVPPKLALDDIPALLADLASILTYKHERIYFLHASFPDFLLDKTRAQVYYLDKGLWCARLSSVCLRLISISVMNISCM